LGGLPWIETGKAGASAEEAKKFYLALGFDPSPLEPMTLMVTLGDILVVLS
jgi:hypothetical protein